MSLIKHQAPAQNSDQRCSVGPAVFEKLSVPVGSWCIVQHDGKESICSLWLRNDLQDGFIEVQDTVTIHTRGTKSQTVGKSSNVSIDSIQPISKPAPCPGIVVSVITDFKHLRNLQRVPREALMRQLQHRLAGHAVVEGSVISLQSGSQFAGPAISHVVVEEFIRDEVTQSDVRGVTEQNEGKDCLTIPLTEEASFSLSDSLQESRPCVSLTGNKGHSVTFASFDNQGNAPSEQISTQSEKDTGITSSRASTSSVSVDSQTPVNSSNAEKTGFLSRSSSVVGQEGSALQVFLITEHTKTRIKHITSKESIQHVYSRTNVRVGGLDKAASLLKRLIEYPAKYPESLGRLGLMQSHGILLRGPPGCGKTSLMQSVASECKVCLLQFSGAEIFGASPGESESNLRQVFDKAIGETHHRVLFIDELDVLCPKRDSGGGTHEARVVAELLMLMDEVRGHGKVLVVGATSKPNALDPALRRPGRFDQEVLVGMPSVSQRASILEAHCRGVHLADNVDLAELAKQCNGYSGADLACLCQQAVFCALERSVASGRRDGGGSSGHLESPVVTMEDFIGSLSHVTPSLHRAAGAILKELQPVSWDAIGGLKKIKAQLKQAVEWPMRHWQSFARLGLRAPSGVLLYGPPGCCKTTLAQAAATACKASFLSMSCAELYSPFVGDSEKILTEVFRKARLTTPSIVFLDELDSLIGGRGTEKGHGLSERLLSCLLVEMDGIGVPADEEIPTGAGVSEKKIQAEISRPRVLVVAASNRKDLIDAALLRPGRFDCLIYVPPPDEEARLEILAVHTKHMPLAEDVNLREIAEATDMFTGADLEGLCREAGLQALQEHGLDNTESCRLHHRHFLSALDWCRPSLTDNLMARYQQTDTQRTQEVR